MNDLISRQAAINAIGEKPFAETADEYDYEQGLQNQWERDVVTIKILPSAEPERKKGKWVMHSDYPDRLICSECTRQFDVWHWESKQMHFCPNCGSDMWSENE